MKKDFSNFHEFGRIRQTDILEFAQNLTAQDWEELREKRAEYRGESPSLDNQPNPQF